MDVRSFSDLKPKKVTGVPLRDPVQGKPVKSISQAIAETPATAIPFSYKAAKHLQQQQQMNKSSSASSNGCHNTDNIRVEVNKLSEHAQLPVNAHTSDSGYDVTILEMIEGRNEINKVSYFSTGITLKPPPGYYFEMYARSSLHKSGYMLATGVSIIDEGYRGELIVPLYKFDYEGKFLALPCRAVQLILRKKLNAVFADTTCYENSHYDSNGECYGERGIGGFGSTGGYN